MLCSGVFRWPFGGQIISGATVDGQLMGQSSDGKIKELENAYLFITDSTWFHPFGQLPAKQAKLRSISVYGPHRFNFQDGMISFLVIFLSEYFIIRRSQKLPIRF